MTPDQLWQISQAGPAGLLVVFGLLLVSGKLATRQEVDAVLREAASERARAMRAEAQLDNLMPAINKLAEMIKELQQQERSNRG